jgi:hypothetical protein
MVLTFVLLNPDLEEIYPREKLGTDKFASASPMHWDSQASGVTIPSDVAAILEKEWANFLSKKSIVSRHR